MNASLKGWRTVLFGLAVIVVPPALTYLGGIDWTSFGISPAVAGVIGVAIISLRAATSTALGVK
jgi:hypothetical protein